MMFIEVPWIKVWTPQMPVMMANFRKVFQNHLGQSGQVCDSEFRGSQIHIWSQTVPNFAFCSTFTRPCRSHLESTWKPWHWKMTPCTKRLGIPTPWPHEIQISSAPGCGLDVYQFHPIPLSWKEINGKYGSIWVWFIVGSFRNGMLSLSKITRRCARCLKANETQSKDPLGLGSCDILGIRPVKLIACHVLRPSCCFIPHF